MTYVIEPNDRAEVAWQDREDREEIARNQLAEQYANEWLAAVTNESLDSFVTFDERTDWQATGTNYKNRVMRESTVLELFNDQYDYKDFSTRIAKIVIDAHKSGNQEATKLLGEMAVSFGEGKV